ncbi:MAG: molybdopterin-dependent oxidoreductase [Pseudomonadota bacterium]|nr:molybdopterin-dependent oxidoreductase [Pseudomonadota bacterium]
MNLAFRLAGADLDGAAKLPGSLHVNRRLSQWLRFDAAGWIEVRTGKVELGQGITTALAQIVADELDVTLERIRMVPASTAASPDEAITSGSLSVQESGLALRHVCAEARSIYLDIAARKLGDDPGSLQVEDGAIRGASAHTSYWELADDTLLEREATGAAATKACSGLAVIGTSVPRFDLPDKVFGAARFIHDIELPGMLHGRMLRVAAPEATLVDLPGLEIVEAMPQLEHVVRDGSFVGVIASSERAATLAIERLARSAQWTRPAGVDAGLPDENALGEWLKLQRAETSVVASKSSPGARTAVRTVRAAFDKPFIAHASIGPSCALAQWQGNTLEVWSHTQGIYNLRRDLAIAFDVSADSVRVHHVEGSGCYGHNPADDVAFDAARLARAAGGRPVRVQWSRADELTSTPVGPAMHVELEADLDAHNEIVGWRHEVWSNGHSTRPGRSRTPALLGSWQLEKPFPRLIAINAPLAAGGGSERNSVPSYEFPAWHIVKHDVQVMPIRTSALRALGAFANVFAIESFMDELAREAAMDPVEFRLRHLRDERARAVIERAATRAGWAQWTPREGFGRGIGFARYKHTSAYCAVVAEIEAGVDIRVRRLVIAVDVGQVINPDGVINQIEGGAIQAASWAVKEAVRFDRERITSEDWDAYPIFRFSDVPEVHVEIIDHPELPSVGAGEASMGPTAGATANAVADALGVRMHALPLTAERIAAVISA